MYLCVHGGHLCSRWSSQGGVSWKCGGVNPAGSSAPRGVRPQEHEGVVHMVRCFLSIGPLDAEVVQSGHRNHSFPGAWRSVCRQASSCTLMHQPPSSALRMPRQPALEVFADRRQTAKPVAVLPLVALAFYTQPTNTPVTKVRDRSKQATLQLLKKKSNKNVTRGTKLQCLVTVRSGNARSQYECRELPPSEAPPLEGRSGMLRHRPYPLRGRRNIT